jgi:hypothetical protein
MVTTEDVLAAVARSPHNWGAGRQAWLREAMTALGAPDDDLVAAALPALDDPDRNVRVRALWALSVLDGDAAAAGVARGLQDPVRRVREVAIKAVAPHHAAAPEVRRRLQQLIDDEDETRRLRQLAFFVMSSSAVRDAVPGMAEETLRSLMDSDRFRSALLLRLCWSTNHSPSSRAALHEFVRSGSREEAVMATRALCGHRLMRVDGWLPADLRQRVRSTYDEAPDVYGGVPLCWIPGPDAQALADEVGIPYAP